MPVVQDGVEAMWYLRELTPYVTSADPDLILLDLNLPKRKMAANLLAEIKSDPGLRRIPVMVLTTSDRPDDISRSYDLFANCYVAKPASLSQLASTVQAIESFWLSTVTLPPR